MRMMNWSTELMYHTGRRMQHWRKSIPKTEQSGHRPDWTGKVFTEPELILLSCVWHPEIRKMEVFTEIIVQTVIFREQFPMISMSDCISFPRLWMRQRLGRKHSMCSIWLTSTAGMCRCRSSWTGRQGQTSVWLRENFPKQKRQRYVRHLRIPLRQPDTGQAYMHLMHGLKTTSIRTLCMTVPCGWHGTTIPRQAIQNQERHIRTWHTIMNSGSIHLLQK